MNSIRSPFMKNIFSISFRQILLLVDQHLTRQDKERFRFLCNDMLPESDSVKSLLEMFEALEERQIISYQDVKILKNFTETIGRLDVTKLISEYETQVGLKMVMYGYLDFRSGFRNVASPLLKTDHISMYLVQARNLGSCNDIMKAVSKNLHCGFPLRELIVNFILKRFSQMGKECTWSDVLEILQICAEFLYLHFMYTPNFNRLTRDVEEIIEEVLMIKVVPWMADEGGITGCSSIVAAKQDLQF